MQSLTFLGIRWYPHEHVIVHENRVRCPLPMLWTGQQLILASFFAHITLFWRFFAATASVVPSSVGF